MRAIRGCMTIVGIVAIIVGILFLMRLLGINIMPGVSQIDTNNTLLALLFVFAFVGLGIVLVLFGTKRLRNLFKF